MLSNRAETRNTFLAFQLNYAISNNSGHDSGLSSATKAILEFSIIMWTV